MAKFKKNDVVVLNNPTKNWSGRFGPELFHGEAGLIINGPNSKGNYKVEHSGSDGDYSPSFYEHESELIKIGTL